MTAKDRKDVRVFSLVGMCLLGLMAASRHFRHHDPRWVYFAAVAAYFAVGAALPVVGRPVYWAAQKATNPISWVMTRLILGVFFYGVLSPVGLLMRVTRRDALRRRMARGEATLWIPKKHPKDPKKQMEMQF